MSTTNHANQPAPAYHPATSGVIHLDALKRRKRLDRLEATRSHLATMAAQQRSHGLEEAQDSFSLQLSIENTIRDEFPDAYEELFARWVENDVAAEHSRGVLSADCGICRSIATAHGLNLLPPEAA